MSGASQPAERQPRLRAVHPARAGAGAADQLWGVPRRAPKATLRGHTGRVRDAVSDGDDTLHTVSRDGTWRTRDPGPRRVAAHVCGRVPAPARAYWERIAPGTPYRDGC